MFDGSDDFARFVAKYLHKEITGRQLAIGFATKAETLMFLGAALCLVASLRPQMPGVGIQHAYGLLLLAAAGISEVYKLRRLNNRFDTFIREANEPDRRLKTVLSDLLETGSEPHASDIAENCEEVILAVAALAKDKRAWSKVRYVQFVSSLMHEVVGQNAMALAKLAEDDPADRPFVVSASAAKLADKILRAQMQELTGEDSYLVISDLETWNRDGLSAFLEETERAVTIRGVSVQRLFNFMLKGVEMPDNCGDILRRHFRAAEEWKKRTTTGKGSYRLKVLRAEDWETIQHKVDEPSDEFREIITTYERGHFGIFLHLENGKEEMMRFRVQDPTLKMMYLNRNRKAIEDGSRKYFTQLWRHCPDLSEPIIKEIEASLAARKPRHGSSPVETPAEGAALGL